MKTRWMGLTPSMGLCLLVGVVCGTPFLSLAATLPDAATGANVDESRVEKTYHVDAANADAADDDKHGTPDAPFATISYACQTAVRDKDRHIGARVLIATGTYREAVEIRPPPGGAPDTDAPLVIESAERGQVIIDGADTGGWSASTWKVEGTNWTHPWPFRRSLPQQAALERILHAAGAPPSASGEAYRRGDLVVINGIILRQVNHMEELAPGCFWGRAPAAVSVRRGNGILAVADADAAVVVQPPADTALNGAIIQVGARAHCLAIHGRCNVVVRGVVLQHAAAPSDGDTPTAGLLLDDCSNVFVDDVFSQWNDGAGLVITGRTSAPGSADFTLRQSHLLHNSGSGLAVLNVGNLLVEDGEACFNNFRGEWADWVDPGGAAGAKVRGVRGSTWRRLRAVGNFCRGVWWDGDDTDVTLEDGTVRDNVIGGLLIGNSPGPVLLRRCLVAGTKAHSGTREEAVWPAGVSVAATPDVTLESNVVAANAVAQLGIWDTAAATAGSNRQVKPVLRAERHAYHHNVFYGGDASQSIYSLPGIDAGGKNGCASYYDTLNTGENCYWNPALAEGFCLRGNPSKPVGPGAGANGRNRMKLEDWRTFLASRPRSKDAVNLTNNQAPEAGSSWQDPLFADPAEGDFRVREQSPAAGWNLPSEEGSSAP